MRRRLRLGGTVFLLSLALWAMAKYRETLSFFLNLYRAHRIGQAFYRNYDHVSRDVPFHPGMAPRLDVYSPVDGDEHPVLVFIHGGSWHQYHKRLFAPVAMKLLPEGMVVVIPDYTLYPGARYEQMANQVAAALSWTLDNIEQHGGDSRRVVIAGHSSGAHLAGLAVLDPRFLAPYGHAGTELCGRRLRRSVRVRFLGSQRGHAQAHRWRDGGSGTLRGCLAHELRTCRPARTAHPRRSRCNRPAEHRSRVPRRAPGRRCTK
jgi:hypothetical protein